MTIGADFAANRMNIDGWEITSNIWDLAGQHRFKKLRETYYRGVSGALLVYDITRPETLTALPGWIEELKRNNNGKLVPMTVIANKTDLREDSDVTVAREEGMAFASKLADDYGETFTFVESSAKTGDNVTRAFEGLIRLIYDRFIEKHNANQ